MATKRRSRTVEIRAISTRRAKSSRQAKKLEDSKLISEQATKTRNVIRQIEKPKSHTDKKPTESISNKLSRQKKVHKCAICLKVFKGKEPQRPSN